MTLLRQILCICVVLLTATQTLWSGQLRTAQMQAAGVNLLCGPPSVTLSPEALKALGEIAELLGEDIPSEGQPSDHCPDCIVAAFDMISSAIPDCFVQTNLTAIYRGSLGPSLSHYGITGPPLGSRAHLF